MLYKFCTRMMSNSDEFPGHGHKRRCEYMKFVKTGLARLTCTVPSGEGDKDDDIVIYFILFISFRFVSFRFVSFRFISWFDIVGFIWF